MRYYIPLLVTLLLSARSIATDLVIDKVLITRHPIPAPYFVYLKATAGRAEAAFQPAKSPYGSGGINGSPIEVALNIVLKDVQPNSWAVLTLQLDPDREAVSTYKALKKHTARIQILEGTHSTQLIPELYNTPFIYEVFYHTK